MSEALKLKPSTDLEVLRLDMHDSVPTLVNSKTISHETFKGKMTYLPDSKVIKFEKSGKVIGFMPDTNIKFIWLK